MTRGPARYQTELEKAALDDRLEAEMLDQLLKEQEQRQQQKAANDNENIS